MWGVRLVAIATAGIAWTTTASAQWFQQWEDMGRRPFWEQDAPRQDLRGPPDSKSYQPTRPSMSLGGPRPDIEPKIPKLVELENNYAPNSIVIDTTARKLYLILSDREAYVYTIAVGRRGYSWTGTEFVSRIAEWPDWLPPKEMIARDRRLPDKMTGGMRNPLGARAIYLGNSLYRIHGTNDARSIGRAASSGCFRMKNEHVVHLASQITAGTLVMVVERMPPISARVSPPPPLPLRGGSAQL